MSLTKTSLAAAMDATGISFRATSVTGATVGGFAKVDGEFMIITAINSPIISVRGRGYEGGVAVAHDILAPVTFGLTSDEILQGAGEEVQAVQEDRDIVTLGQNGNIAAPIRDTIVFLTKGSALASSNIAAPSLAADGVRLTIINTTAFAHVLTATGLIDNGVTGGAKATITFGAFVGSAIELMAFNGHWIQLSATVAPVT